MRKSLLIIPFAAALTMPALAAGSDSIFMIRTSERTPAQVVAAIETYVLKMKWRYLGASKVKKGQVTLVKLCIPLVGRTLWPAGLKLSAMLPCGNVGVYREGGKTQISTLHPRYMHLLYPSKATKRAADIAVPLLSKMLNSVAK